MTVFHSRPYALAFAVVFASSAALGAESDRFFSGPYLALDLSRQNTIAGALVAGVDTLAQASRNVATVSGGYRYQFEGGLVVGLEGGFGVTDGDLAYSDPPNGLAIDYKNSSQYALGGTAGYAFGAGRGTLIYAYLSETKRSFDVTVRGPLGLGSQTDKQGLLRYGVGLERRIGENLGLRASLGSSRAKFSNRTNIDPKTRIDFSLGAVWQF